MQESDEDESDADIDVDIDQQLDVEVALNEVAPTNVEPQQPHEVSMSSFRCVVAARRCHCQAVEWRTC